MIDQCLAISRGQRPQPRQAPTPDRPEPARRASKSSRRRSHRTHAVSATGQLRHRVQRGRHIIGDEQLGADLAMQSRWFRGAVGTTATRHHGASATRRRSAWTSRSSRSVAPRRTPTARQLQRLRLHLGQCGLPRSDPRAPGQPALRVPPARRHKKTTKHATSAARRGAVAQRSRSRRMCSPGEWRELSSLRRHTGITQRNLPLHLPLCGTAIARLAQGCQGDGWFQPPTWRARTARRPHQ